MLWIRRALMAIGVLLVALFMIVAVLENQQTTHLELFGLSSPEFPVVLYLALGFILGGVIGLLVSVPILARLHTQLRSTRDDLSRLRNGMDSRQLASGQPEK
ncbi:TPA: LapA family protein [Pseudomonas aeruginosa]|nr:LapA family protein [Pseudomonas aeruginosa]